MKVLVYNCKSFEHQLGKQFKRNYCKTHKEQTFSGLNLEIWGRREHDSRVTVGHISQRHSFYFYNGRQESLWCILLELNTLLQDPRTEEVALLPGQLVSPL